MATREYPLDYQAVRIQLDLAWSADDLAELLADLAGLYEMRVRLEWDPESLEYWSARLLRGPSSSRAAPWRNRDDSTWRLDIGRVHYGSPGFVDLVGVGKVVEQIRLFVEKLIDLRAARLRQGLENEKLKAEIEAQKIENARNFVRLALAGRPFGLSDEQIRALVYDVDGVQERIIRRIGDGQVTGVEQAPLPGEEGVEQESH